MQKTRYDLPTWPFGYNSMPFVMIELRYAWAPLGAGSVNFGHLFTYVNKIMAPKECRASNFRPRPAPTRRIPHQIWQVEILSRSQTSLVRRPLYVTKIKNCYFKLWANSIATLIGQLHVYSTVFCLASSFGTVKRKIEREVGDHFAALRFQTPTQSGDRIERFR